MSLVKMCDKCGALEFEMDQKILFVELEIRDKIDSEIADEVEHICEDCLNFEIEENGLDCYVTKYGCVTENYKETK